MSDCTMFSTQRYFFHYSTAAPFPLKLVWMWISHTAVGRIYCMWSRVSLRLFLLLQTLATYLLHIPAQIPVLCSVTCRYSNFSIRDEIRDWLQPDIGFSLSVCVEKETTTELNIDYSRECFHAADGENFLSHLQFVGSYFYSCLLTACCGFCCTVVMMLKTCKMVWKSQQESPHPK